MEYLINFLNSTVPIFLAFVLAFLYDMSKKLGRISENLAVTAAHTTLQGKRLDRLELKVGKKKPTKNVG